MAERTSLRLRLEKLFNLTPPKIVKNETKQNNTKINSINPFLTEWNSLVPHTDTDDVGSPVLSYKVISH